MALVPELSLDAAGTQQLEGGHSLCHPHRQHVTAGSDKQTFVIVSPRQTAHCLVLGKEETMVSLELNSS